MRAAVLAHFVGIERGVNAAEDDGRPASRAPAGRPIAAQRVAGVDADADDIAGRDGRRIERFERLVDD